MVFKAHFKRSSSGAWGSGGWGLAAGRILQWRYRNHRVYLQILTACVTRLDVEEVNRRLKLGTTRSDTTYYLVGKCHFPLIRGAQKWLPHSRAQDPLTPRHIPHTGSWLTSLCPPGYQTSRRKRKISKVTIKEEQAKQRIRSLKAEGSVGEKTEPATGWASLIQKPEPPKCSKIWNR